jgi:hypothetical protein
MTLLSNAIVDAAVMADLATLQREVEPTLGPLGFGTELSCVTDVTPDFAMTDPDSPEGIAEATIRRWTTPRGALIDDLLYGFDLRAYCNRGVSSNELRTLALALEAEATKDDRIDTIDVTVTTSRGARALDTLTVGALITPADATLIQFTLTFSVTNAGVLIETIALAGVGTGAVGI